MKTNIKEELYYYAYREDYVENTKDIKLGKKESIFIYVIISFFIIMFSLPILFGNIILWIFITLLGMCILLINGREKNAYLKSLLNFVIVLFYFGFIVACDIVIASQDKFQISRQSELVITLLLGFLTYDVGVIINIVLKKYSAKNQCRIKVKTERNIWDYMGPLLGTSIGRSLSHNFGNTSALDWVLILMCSIILTLSLVFLQKYLICKLLYSKKINNKS